MFQRVDGVFKYAETRRDERLPRFTHLPLYGLTRDQLDYMADAILESIDEMQKGV